MHTGDRFTRLLLLIIAVFLGILVGKSLFQGAPRAQAQVKSAADALTSAEKAVSKTINAVTGSEGGQSVLSNYNQNSMNNEGDVLSYRTMPISTISVSTKDKIRTINVVDTASSFIVQFDDRIEVYRIDAMNLSQVAAQSAKTNQ